MHWGWGRGQYFKITEHTVSDRTHCLRYLDLFYRRVEARAPCSYDLGMVFFLRGVEGVETWLLTGNHKVCL